jgi:ribonuclease-3
MAGGEGSGDERRAALARLEERLGHAFADPALLERALTHKSWAHEQPGLAAHNEPLEFLGDAVLGLVVSDLLHRRDPDGDEGPKSFARAALVSAPRLARAADELGLPELLRLGRGEEKTGGRKKAALWADAFEAVLAAVYLDGGIVPAHRLLERVFSREIGTGAVLGQRDHKSALQERLQGRGAPLPEYVVAAEEGPGHRRRFRVRCQLEGREISEGEGHSKKAAQQEAARRALEALDLEGAPAGGCPPRRHEAHE